MASSAAPPAPDREEANGDTAADEGTAEASMARAAAAAADERGAQGEAAAAGGGEAREAPAPPAAAATAAGGAGEAQAAAPAPRSGSKLFLSMAVSKMADMMGRGAQAKAVKDACAEFQGEADDGAAPDATPAPAARD